jgi:hypothetical protein
LKNSVEEEKNSWKNSGAQRVWWYGKSHTAEQAGKENPVSDFDRKEDKPEASEDVEGHLFDKFEKAEKAEDVEGHLFDKFEKAEKAEELDVEGHMFDKFEKAEKAEKAE